ncbi:hypothetical protein BGZ47_008473 [Haplosporangium gracile]|nr:hypothetical protein BGZ47_008473 [Haplosporangium gracile]
MDNARFMDLFMDVTADMGLFDDCTQSALLSNAQPQMASSFSVASASTAASASTSVSAMNLNSYVFPSNDIANMTWDTTLPKQFQPFVPVAPLTMDFTPELSPALSYCTPAMNSVRSPYAFDNLGLDELGSSPSVGSQSPMDEIFGSQQSQESFDYDFGVVIPQSNTTMNAVWSPQGDFELFPTDTNPSVTSLQQLLMTPAPMETELAALEESPFESDLDYFSPLASECGSPEVSDFADAFNDFKRHQSDYRPPQRPRRRRLTSEEDARVVIEKTKEGTNDKPRYQCKVCDKTFSRPFNLRSHRATHAGVKPYVCTHENEKNEVCGWSFARRHDLERHVRSRHSAEKLFKCKTCPIQCGRSDAFKRHLQRHPACGLAAQLEAEAQAQAEAGVESAVKAEDIS